MKKVQQLALEHAEWITELIKKVFVDAFIHGWKHAKEENV